MSWNEGASKQTTFSWSRGLASCGGAGLVDGLMSLVEQGGGEALVWEEVYAATSVAFKHYVYEERYNPPYEPPRYFSSKGEIFSNYGLIEAFAQETGWEVREFNFLSMADLSRLLAFELGEGRGVLTYGVEAPQVCVVVGIWAGPMQLEIEVVDRVGGRHHVDLRSRGGLQGGEEEEDLVNWCVVARPDVPNEWAMSRAQRRLNVWEWACKHGRHKKEFFHETRENYAVGLSAYATLLGSVRARREGLEDQEERAALDEAVLAHVEELWRGRQAAAATIGPWSEAFMDGEGAPEVEVVPAKRGEFAEAAQRCEASYGEVAEALAQALRAPRQVNEAFWEGVRRAGEAEAEALAALEVMTRQMRRA